MSRLKAPVSTALTRVALSPVGLNLAIQPDLGQDLDLGHLNQDRLQVLCRRPRLPPQAHPVRARQGLLGLKPLRLNGTGERVFHRFIKALPVAGSRSHT